MLFRHLAVRRLLVLVSFLAIVAGLSNIGLGLVGCGGNDKPPLTPDSVEPMVDGPETGAPAPK